MPHLFIACLLLLLSASAGWGHPGVGIVMDRKGNVFYTDLFHVWRIAPSGQKSIAVRDVHTHELAIDSADNVFGEDNEYLGGDRYRHRIWRRSPDGRVTDVQFWRDGFWPEYGFVRDQSGAMYWAQCPERICVIRRRTPDGKSSIVAPGVRFNHPINWIATGPGGSLYVIDGTDLRRLQPDGRITTVVRNLGTVLMGLWLDAQSNLYVAAWGTRAIFRVRPNGKVTTVARTRKPWGPSGVLVARDGAIWILETSTSNALRVRRVTTNGQSAIY